MNPPAADRSTGRYNEDALMTTLHKNECVVLLPSSQHFTRLYDEILSLAIIDAEMLPARVQRDFNYPFPLGLLVQKIERATALFADLSENDAEIWFAVGCAIALKKPFCLISSNPQSSTRMTVEQPPILYYPGDAFPSDYIQLQQRITEHLSTAIPHAEIVDSIPQLPEPKPSVTHFSAPTLFEPEPLLPAPAASYSEDLASYEILALTIIHQKSSEIGLSPRALGLEMQTSDSAHLTSHAINALKRRRFIERRPTQITGSHSPQISENLFVTDIGEDWLIRYRRKSSAHRSSSISREMFTTTP